MILDWPQKIDNCKGGKIACITLLNYMTGYNFIRIEFDDGSKLVMRDGMEDLPDEYKIRSLKTDANLDNFVGSTFLGVEEVNIEDIPAIYENQQFHILTSAGIIPVYYKFSGKMFFHITAVNADGSGW